MPITNFMSWQNLYKYWVVNIIYTVCFVNTYLFLWNSSPHLSAFPLSINRQSSLLQDTQSATLFFKVSLIYMIGDVIIFYDGVQFKEGLMSNRALKLWIIVAVLLAVFGMFFDRVFIMLTLAKLSIGLEVFILGILIGGTALGYYCVRLVPSYYTGSLGAEEQNLNEKHQKPDIMHN
jgi:magnesium-transporting ATPase (P-type)